MPGTFEDVKKLLVGPNDELNDCPDQNHYLFSKIRTFNIEDSDAEYFLKHGRISEKKKRSKGAVRVASVNLGEERLSKIIPYQFNGFLDKSRVDEDKVHYWWRGISAAYLMRPNQNTRKLISEYSTPGLSELNGRCVSMYIRHGDKAKEMKLVPVEQYMSTAESVWNLSFPVLSSSHTPLDQRSSRPAIFFGTETPEVVEASIVWGMRHNWTIIFNPLQLDIFLRTHQSVPNITDIIMKEERGHNKRHLVTQHNLRVNHTVPSFRSLYESGITIESHRSGYSAPYTKSTYHIQQKSNLKQRTPQAPLTANPPRSSPRHHHHVNTHNSVKHFARQVFRVSGHTAMEFPSFLINMADLMRCNAFVCTLMSNYCRLLDEFRALIAAKQSAIFADISEETCGRVPCINHENVITYEWR